MQNRDNIIIIIFLTYLVPVVPVHLSPLFFGVRNRRGYEGGGGGRRGYENHRSTGGMRNGAPVVVYFTNGGTNGLFDNTGGLPEVTGSTGAYRP